MSKLKYLFYILFLIMFCILNLCKGKQGQACKVSSDCHAENEVCGIGTNICIPRLWG
ncbi:hypothetical protein Mgra_00002888 [Meloidogyne graminicola]|uniref:Uncharacterized protein n=1 Tax=Meloidogyne graminicola TaxID=189291 RepID=A0A8S9ZWI5_9BILA|nr:hypothetical protein Mgra_00002888 [Meloidogyne graminicola]